MKTKTALILLFAIIINIAAPLAVFSAELKWPTDYKLSGLQMPFRPADKYETMQNPPDFAWSAVTDATAYDLIVCKDEALTDIVYQKSNVTTNFYNFDHTFEIDTYYWSVRYKVGNKLSEWAPARRFRISPDASEFPVPDIEVLASRIPKEHPRLWMKDGLEKFRTYGETEEGKAYLKRLEEYVLENFDDPLDEEPQFEDFKDDNEKFYVLRGTILYNLSYKIIFGAFLYLMTGNEDYGSFAKKHLLNLASWDPDGVTNYTSQDQVHREITYFSAIAYDWLYPLLSEEEKSEIIEMIRIRTMVMANDLIYGNISMSDRPYESHGSSAHAILIVISMILYDDMPEAADIFRQALPFFINNNPTYSSEDGGYSQGVFYYKSTAVHRSFIVDSLKHTGIIDMHKKAWSVAEPYFPIHTWPMGSVGAFGDGSYVVPTTHMNYKNVRLATTQGHSFSKWAAEEIGDYTDNYNINDSEVPVATFLDVVDGYFEMEAEPPYTVDKGMRFKDIGWATMHSDLVDQKRVSLFFKSSPYGSYNHSHADQNTFVIQGFGERLAIDSGYYAYGTDWENKYVRNTFAHNGITIDGGKGQQINNFDAKGYLTEYINSEDFDVVRGDATEAYAGAMKKAYRNIIFIRPDMYIVIDDLESVKKNGSNYEFWLNAMNNTISVNEDARAIRIKKNSAVLDAALHYPKKANIKYSDVFSGADLNPVPTTETYKNFEVQQRAWFETEKLKKTKMVTTLDVHLKDENRENIKTTDYDDCLKMEFENGTVVYVNTGDKETVSCDNIEFSGLAYVENAYAKMLVTGNYLKKDGVTLFESDIPLSVSLGRGILDISASDDFSLKAYIPSLEALADTDGNELTKERGITYEKDGDCYTFNADMGDYELSVNNAPSEPEVSEGSIRVVMDGKESIVRADKITELDGTVTMHGNIINTAQKYIVTDKSDGFNLQNAAINEVVYLKENVKFSSYNCESPYLIINTVPVADYPMVEHKDHEALKAELDVLIEAEYLTAKTGIPYTYYTREYMSNKGGVSQVYDENDTITYEFEIEEDGYYDLCVKGVAWVDGTKRQFVIDNYAGMFLMPKTPSWGAVASDWTSERVDTNLWLEKGTHKMVIQGLNNYSNFDWFGFIKD